MLSQTVIVHRTVEPQSDGALLSSSPTLSQTPWLAPLQTWCYNDMQSGETCVVRLYEQPSLGVADDLGAAPGAPLSRRGGGCLTWEFAWLDAGRPPFDTQQPPLRPSQTAAACRARFAFPTADEGRSLAGELGGVVFLSARHVLVRADADRAKKDPNAEAPALSLFSLVEAPDGGRGGRRWRLFLRVVPLTASLRSDATLRRGRPGRVLHVSMVPKVWEEGAAGKPTPSARLVYLLSAESEDGTDGNFDFVVGVLSVTVGDVEQTLARSPEDSLSLPPLTVVVEHLHIERGVPFAASREEAALGGLRPTDCVWVLVPASVETLVAPWLTPKAAASNNTIAGRLIGVLPPAYRVVEQTRSPQASHEAPSRVCMSHLPRVHCCGSPKRGQASRGPHDITHSPVPAANKNNNDDVDDSEKVYIGLSLVSKSLDNTTALQSDLWVGGGGRRNEQEKGGAEEILERWMNGERLVHLVPLQDEDLPKKPLISPLCTELPLSSGASCPIDTSIVSSSPVFLEIFVNFFSHSHTRKHVKTGVYVSELTWKDVMHPQACERSALCKIPVLQVPSRGHVVWDGLNAIVSPSPRSAGESEKMEEEAPSQYAWVACSPLSTFSTKLTTAAVAPMRGSIASQPVRAVGRNTSGSVSVVCCRTFLACHVTRELWRLSDVYEVLWAPALDVGAELHDRNSTNRGPPLAEGWNAFLYLEPPSHHEKRESWSEYDADWGRDDESEDDLSMNCLLDGGKTQNDDPARVAWSLVNKVWCVASRGARNGCARLLHAISEHPYILALDSSGKFSSLEAYLSNLNTTLACESYQSNIGDFAKKFSTSFLKLLIHLDWLATSEWAKHIRRWAILFFIGVVPPSSGSRNRQPHIDGESHVEVQVAMQYLIFCYACFFPRGSPRDEAESGQEAPRFPSSSAQLAWLRRMLLLYAHCNDAVPLEVLLEDLFVGCSTVSKGDPLLSEAAGGGPERGNSRVVGLECALLRAVDVEQLMKGLASLSVHGEGLLTPKDFIPLCCQWNRRAMPAPLFFIAAAVDVAAHDGPRSLLRREISERVGMWKRFKSENSSALSSKDDSKSKHAATPSWIPSFLLPDGPTWVALADYPWAALPPLTLLLFWLESACAGEGGAGVLTTASPYPPHGRLLKALHVLYWLCQGQEDAAKELLRSMHAIARDAQVKNGDNMETAGVESDPCDDASSPAPSTQRRDISLSSFAVLLDSQTLVPCPKREWKGRQDNITTVAVTIPLLDSFLVARVLHQCFAHCTGKTMRHLMAAAAFSFLPGSTTATSSSVTPSDEDDMVEDMRTHTIYLLSLIPDQEHCLVGLESCSDEARLRRLALELAARVWEFVLLNDTVAPMNAVLIEKLVDAFIYLHNMQEKLQLGQQQGAEFSKMLNALLHADLGVLLFRFMRGVFMLVLPKQLERVLLDEAPPSSTASPYKRMPVYPQYDSIELPIGTIQAIGRDKVSGATSPKAPASPSAVAMMQASEVAGVTRQHVKRLLDLFQTHGLRVQCLRALHSITPTAMDFADLVRRKRMQGKRDTLVWMAYGSPIFQSLVEKRDTPCEEASYGGSNDDGRCFPKQPLSEESMHTGIPILLPVPLSYVLASQASPTDPANLLFVSVLLRYQIKQLILQYLWDNDILESVRSSPREILCEDEDCVVDKHARSTQKALSPDEILSRDSLTLLRARPFNCKNYINEMVEALDPIAHALVSTGFELYEPLIVLLFLDITDQLVEGGECKAPPTGRAGHPWIQFPAGTAVSMRECIRVAAQRTFSGFEASKKKILRFLLRKAFYPYLGPLERNEEEWGGEDHGSETSWQEGKGELDMAREAFLTGVASESGRYGTAVPSYGVSRGGTDKKMGLESPNEGMTSALPSAMANFGEAIRTAVANGLPPVFSPPARVCGGPSPSEDLASAADATLLPQTAALLEEEASLRMQLCSSIQRDYEEFLRSPAFQQVTVSFYIALYNEKVMRMLYQFALEQTNLLFTFQEGLFEVLLCGFHEQAHQIAREVAERRRQQEQDIHIGNEALCAAERHSSSLAEPAQGSWETPMRNPKPTPKQRSHPVLRAVASFGSTDSLDDADHPKHDDSKESRIGLRRASLPPPLPPQQEESKASKVVSMGSEREHAPRVGPTPPLLATTEHSINASLSIIAGAGEGFLSAFASFKTKLRETVAPAPPTRQTTGPPAPLCNTERSLAATALSLPNEDNDGSWEWPGDDSPDGEVWGNGTEKEEEALHTTHHSQGVSAMSLLSLIEKRDLSQSLEGSGVAGPDRRGSASVPSAIPLPPPGAAPTRGEAPMVRIIPLTKTSKEGHLKDAGAGEFSGSTPLQPSKRKSKRAPLAVVLPSQSACPLTPPATLKAPEEVEKEAERVAAAAAVVLVAPPPLILHPSAEPVGFDESGGPADDVERSNEEETVGAALGPAVPQVEGESESVDVVLSRETTEDKVAVALVQQLVEEELQNRWEIYLNEVIQRESLWRDVALMLCI